MEGIGGKMVEVAGILPPSQSLQRTRCPRCRPNLRAEVSNSASLLTRGIRINVVNPAPIVEPGQEGNGLVTAAETAKLYI